MNGPIPTFEAKRAWNAIQALLKLDIGDDIDVDCIGAEDFDEDGMLTLRTPAARVLFLDESDPKQLDNQGLNYTTDLMFAVLCADDDRSADPQIQRDKSLDVAFAVMDSLVGARLVMGNGITSDPVLYAGMKPMATAASGMAYVPAFRVGGTAQFRGRNAVPLQPEEGENNG